MDITKGQWIGAIIAGTVIGGPIGMFLGVGVVDGGEAGLIIGTLFGALAFIFMIAGVQQKQNESATVARAAQKMLDE